MGRKLYVGNLAFGVGDEELQAAFEAAGQVASALVVKDRATGQSRGFAFIEMGSDEDAQRAISMINGKEIGGRAVVVNEARPREEGGGGGAGGRGGPGGRRGPGGPPRRPGGGGSGRGRSW